MNILLIALLISPIFLDRFYYVFVHCFIFSFIFLKFPDRKYIRPLLLFSLLLMAGFVGNLYSDSSFHINDVFRDVLILVKIFVSFGLGYTFGKLIPNPNKIYKYVVFSCLIYICLYFYKIFTYYLISGNPFLMAPTLYRQTFGSGEFAVVVGVVYLYFCREIQKSYRIILISLFLLQVVLSQSRTSFLFIFIYFFIFTVQKLKPVYRFWSTFIFILSTILIFYSGVFTNLQFSNNKLISKIGRSVEEVFPADSPDLETVSMNWRGYESFRAVKEIKSFDIVTHLFGGGFGKRIDLGLNMSLAGNDYSSVPFIHNGYLLLYIKLGIIGFLSFLTFHIYQIRLIFKGFIREKFYGNNYLCLLVFSIISTILMAGLLEVNDLASINLLLGHSYYLLIRGENVSKL